MAFNQIGMSDRIGESSPSSGTQAWSASSNAAPNSDGNTFPENNGKGASASSGAEAPSAPTLGDLPPNYFDISIVPNNAVLHYNEVTPYTEPSKAEIERKSEGVLSFDPLIDRNPDQLWLYFMTYLNEKPSFGVNIHGYHMETYIAYEQHRTADGHTHTHPVQRTRTVTDFNFSLNLTPYVSQQWWRVAVIPSAKTIKAGENVSLRDAIEQYTHSEKSIKEIICQKQLVGWNFQELQDKIKTLIYSSGYHCPINVTFTVNNSKISARSSSKISRYSNSTAVRVLCVVSCLFLIFGPIYLCLRSAGSTRDQIVADYAMTAPADAFLHMNAGVIVNAAIARSYENYLAYIA